MPLAVLVETGDGRPQVLLQARARGQDHGFVSPLLGVLSQRASDVLTTHFIRKKGARR